MLDHVFRNWIAYAVAVVFATTGLVGVTVAKYAAVERVSLTLTDKESVSTSSGHEYRLYTSAGTFTVGDSLVHPRFNASDVYGGLKKGQHYECEVYGWRLGLLSMFKNVLKCEPS